MYPAEKHNTVFASCKKLRGRACWNASMVKLDLLGVPWNSESETWQGCDWSMEMIWEQCDTMGSVLETWCQFHWDYVMGAGATISKALNRCVATGTAGFLAIGVEQVADFCGHPWEAVLIGASVMVIGESQKSITFVILSHHRCTSYSSTTSTSFLYWLYIIRETIMWLKSEIVHFDVMTASLKDCRHIQ